MGMWVKGPPNFKNTKICFEIFHAGFHLSDKRYYSRFLSCDRLTLLLITGGSDYKS